MLQYTLSSSLACNDITCHRFTRKRRFCRYEKGKNITACVLPAKPARTADLGCCFIVVVRASECAHKVLLHQMNSALWTAPKPAHTLESQHCNLARAQGLCGQSWGDGIAKSGGARRKWEERKWGGLKICCGLSAMHDNDDDGVVLWVFGLDAIAGSISVSDGPFVRKM